MNGKLRRAGFTLDNRKPPKVFNPGSAKRKRVFLKVDSGRGRQATGEVKRVPPKYSPEGQEVSSPLQRRLSSLHA